MTEQQLRLYRLLWQRRHDPVSPTFEELRLALGMSSKQGIYRLVNALEEQGLVQRLRHRARTLSLTSKFPPGFAQQVHEMWGYETDRRDLPGERVVQTLSLAFFASQLPERLKPDPTTNPKPVRVRVIIERID